MGNILKGKHRSCYQMIASSSLVASFMHTYTRLDSSHLNVDLRLPPSSTFYHRSSRRTLQKEEVRIWTRNSFHMFPFQYVCKSGGGKSFWISLMEGKYHLHDGSSRRSFRNFTRDLGGNARSLRAVAVLKEILIYADFIIINVVTPYN